MARMLPTLYTVQCTESTTAFRAPLRILHMPNPWVSNLGEPIRGSLKLLTAVDMIKTQHGVNTRSSRSATGELSSVYLSTDQTRRRCDTTVACVTHASVRIYPS